MSPAAITTDLPAALNWLASLPIVVVLPDPFTPTTSTTCGRFGYKGIGLAIVRDLCRTVGGEDVVVQAVRADIDQLIQGQVVTNMRDYALWGVYISNFVFFVATSFVAAIIVAVLRLTKSEWRRPFVRLAESSL